MHEQLEVLTTGAGAVVAVVLGLLWGSFANVMIYRLPEKRSVVRPGSHCSACKAPIAWYDNVPILSYLWLRGHCRACKVAFSPRYLMVEALTGALFGVAWWFTLGTGGMLMLETVEVRALRFCIYAAFAFTMIVIAFIDLDHKLILHRVTYPALVVFYAATFALPGVRWWEGLVGAAIGYGVPWLIGEIYFRITKREGLGLGDSDLLAVIGALLGWRGVVVALFGGSLIGSVIGITALVATRPPKAADEDSDDSVGPTLMKTELPFAPFLTLAAVFYLFAAPWIELHFRL